MKKKPAYRIEHDYIDWGSGFPVVIVDARIEPVPIGGEAAIINYYELAKVVANLLVHKPARFTGNEARFIRLHLRHTLQAMGASLGVSHAAVKKWEGKGDGATEMSWATEKDLRLTLFAALNPKHKEFRKVFDSLQPVPKERGPHGYRIEYADVAPSRNQRVQTAA